MRSWLFIDARNIFTQVDRAHREFSPEQIRNIGIISRLHKGRREEFIQLVDEYFAKGICQLEENAALIPGISERLLDVLEDEEGETAVKGLTAQWQDWEKLQKAYQTYLASGNGNTGIESRNNLIHSSRLCTMG